MDSDPNLETLFPPMTLVGFPTGRIIGCKKDSPIYSHESWHKYTGWVRFGVTAIVFPATYIVTGNYIVTCVISAVISVVYSCFDEFMADMLAFAIHGSEFVEALREIHRNGEPSNAVLKVLAKCMYFHRWVIWRI